MTSFFETIHCQSKAHCQICRNRDGGRAWRRQILDIFKTEVGEDFACPDGIEWGIKEPPLMEKPIETDSRPAKTLKQAASFGQAILTGEYVSKEILDERIAVCGKCKFLKIDPKGVEFCGICGCKTSADERKIDNLAAYKENLPNWGCKFPGRPNTGGWKR